jgi:hypothetical protein
MFRFMRSQSHTRATCRYHLPLPRVTNYVSPHQPYSYFLPAVRPTVLLTRSATQYLFLVNSKKKKNPKNKIAKKKRKKKKNVILFYVLLVFFFFSILKKKIKFKIQKFKIYIYIVGFTFCFYLNKPRSSQAIEPLS